MHKVGCVIVFTIQASSHTNFHIIYSVQHLFWTTFRLTFESVFNPGRGGAACLPSSVQAMFFKKLLFIIVILLF